MAHGGSGSSLRALGPACAHRGWGKELPRPYLPKAPYVLTILRGLKDVFMTCVGLSRLTTTGTLSQATRMPRATCTACRTMQPGGGQRGGRWAELCSGAQTLGGPLLPSWDSG